MEIKVKDLKERTVPVRFGPVSDPEKFKIDLLESAKRLLSIKDFDEIKLEIGARLSESPYSDTGRHHMSLNYLCEGSVWLNFDSNDSYANISLVPHLHSTAVPPHHNFYLYSTDFDGSTSSDKKIPGHCIPTDEPIAISITLDKETLKGTLVSP